MLGRKRMTDRGATSGRDSENIRWGRYLLARSNARARTIRRFWLDGRNTLMSSQSACGTRSLPVARRTCAVYMSIMGYLVDSSSHYILGVGVPALVASTIVL